MAWTGSSLSNAIIFLELAPQTSFSVAPEGFELKSFEAQSLPPDA